MCHVTMLVSSKRVKMMLLTFTVLALIGSTAPCDVGVPHESSTLNVPRIASESGTEVYLGLENPASCGGYLKNYTICYFNVNAGASVYSGELSIWEAGLESDGFRVFDKIIGSVLDFPLNLNNSRSCGIDPVMTPISNAPGPYPAEEMVCMYYCLPETSIVFVKPGSVVGIVYTDGVRYGRGQILTHHTLQTVGTCVGNNLIYSLGDVVKTSCPLLPANTTTALLAGAGIEPIYCPELSLQYGSINISGPYSFGTGIEYTCETGFQLVGVSSQTCLSSGDWSDGLPYCNVLNCTDPGVPSNGGHIGSIFLNGSELYFECDDSYTLEGPESITCYRGTWSDPVPQCVLSNSTSTPTETPTSTNAGFTIIVALVILLIIIFTLCGCTILLVIVCKRCQPRKVISPHPTSTLELTSFNQPTAAPSMYQHNTQIDQPNRMPGIPNKGFGTSDESYYKKTDSYSVGPFPPPLPSPPPFPSPSPYSPSRGQYETYEKIREDEGGDSTYWVPANVEEELYLQLDKCRVRRIPSPEIKVLELLGSGYFATVNRAVWLKPNLGEEEVAVKILSEKADNEDRIKFLQEAALMGQFKHTNVLTLHGVVTTDTSVMIVTELMKNGDLHHWLLKTKREGADLQTTPGVLLNFCRQICLGMAYLSSRQFVHRDLAARNILVTHDNICKISDFGMSRDLTEDEDYYMAGEGGLIPVKWTAPESIKQHKYSSASDVWSYGCVMYEIWSLGRKPFDTLKNNETVKTVNSGRRLSPSPGCPKKMYEIMMKCWHPESKKRPSFNEIMLLLLKDDSTLLLIPDEDRLAHSEAGQLGAPLEAGDKLYTDLQSMYITNH
ncbi:PREDICTED: uncharacterized protein LOC100635491 [Amphimedon queenslandica]|uniref:Protein kinase domain-containing protein n=1 Tax=Amphimedon queenslandica TaxID=400682 RepID=A0AAN0JF99_AMPQE|nr:PREDICTED: uncharacterized protein LOC100635491 [Amphimedon queenslandica]|eukprot:XP_019855452.1 PREDICTED: uncharacterized protein LOC100635491 [Amphimedon queenslandica]